MKCSLGISNFLGETYSLSHSVVFFYFLHWLLKKAFLSLLAILWNSAFRCLYLSFSLWLFTSLLFTAICKASPDSHFAFLHFFSMGIILILASYTISWTSVHGIFQARVLEWGAMEKLYTVNENETRSWLWLRSRTPYYQIQTEIEESRKNR